MDTAAALAALGEAIRADIRRELDPLQKELEHEKKLRELLEQQLLRFQEEVYKRSEVDGLLEGLKKRAEAGVEASKAECEGALRLAQRELEFQIQSARETEKHAAANNMRKNEDMPLLVREIDRKLGTVLVDLDRRLEAAQAEVVSKVKETLDTSVQHADAGDGILIARVEQVLTDLNEFKLETGKAIDSHGAIKADFEGRLGDLKLSLEQKIGMVQLEVDQVRSDFQHHLT